MAEPESIIADAVRTERATAVFYRLFAEIVDDATVSAALVALATTEESHATSLSEIHRALTGEAIGPGAASTEGGLDLFDFSSRSLEEVFEVAIRNERQAARLYSEQAETTKDPKTEMTLRLLAADELRHEEYLRSQLERLRGASVP